MDTEYKGINNRKILEEILTHLKVSLKNRRKTLTS